MRFPLTSRIAGRHTWDRMSVNFLFIPGVMALGAILLAWLMYWWDGQIPNEVLYTSRFIISGSPSELRHASADNASILLHRLQTINAIGVDTKSPEALQILLHHVTLIQVESETGSLVEGDRQSIRRSGEDLHLKFKSVV
jgi:hypothetical protein